MQSPEEREAALARSTREKIRRAAQEIACGRGDSLDRLVAAWPYLRPIFPKAVPGQTGLTDAQKVELNGILSSMGGARGAGASGPDIRAIERWEAERVADRIRRLAGSLPSDQLRIVQPHHVTPAPSGRP
jgi:hypothetical protein